MSTLETDLVQAATGTNTALKLKGKGSGVVKLGDGELSFPDSDGSASQVLQTDGSGSLSFSDTLGGSSAELADLYLADGGVIYFGDDQDVTVTHDPDDGLFLKSTATADNNPFVITLQTGETDMAADDVLGKIAFQAPDEGTGTDAILVAAAIQAISEGDFSSSNNATSLQFMTGVSEAAAAKMSVTSGGDVKVLTDGASIFFGADSEIELRHVADDGLILKHVGTGDGKEPSLTFQAGDNDIAADDVLGSIFFQAPDEGAGTDAILVAAGIEAVSEGNFSSSNNATKLSFKTAASEAASEKMSLSSAGLLTVADDIVFKDGGTIGVSSATDAMTVSSAGIVTFKDDVLLKDAGTIGNASIADVIHLAATETVFNEGGANLDFRVEADGNAYSCFHDASADGGLGKWKFGGTLAAFERADAVFEIHQDHTHSTHKFGLMLVDLNARDVAATDSAPEQRQLINMNIDDQDNTGGIRFFSVQDMDYDGGVYGVAGSSYAHFTIMCFREQGTSNIGMCIAAGGWASTNHTVIMAPVILAGTMTMPTLAHGGTSVGLTLDFGNESTGIFNCQAMQFTAGAPSNAS